MKGFFKYAIVLSLGLAVGFIVSRPLNLEDVTELKWLDQTNIIVTRARAFVSAKSEADVVPIDRAAATLVDEDLDYRIAQRIGSLEGWRSFLAAHESGAHAQSARAEAQVFAGKAPTQTTAEVSDSVSTETKVVSEVAPSAPPSPAAENAALAAPAQAVGAEVSNSASTDAKASEVVPSAPPSQRTEVVALATPAQAPAEVSNGASMDAKVVSEVVPSAPPSPGTEVAALASDEICDRDGDRLERLRSSPTSDEAARFANELRCEKLRPQLVALMESFSYAPPALAAAPPMPPVRDDSALDPKWRATGPPSRTHRTASRSLQPRRHANGCDFRSACYWRAATLPPILLALIGGKLKNSSVFEHTLALARPNDDLRGR